MKKSLKNSPVELSIVIVNYNTTRLLLRCINSIRQASSNFQNPKCEVIVVDNASNDGSVEKLKNLKTEKLKFQLVENKNNLGYARAINQGIKASLGDYLFILNPDTKLTKGAIDTPWQYTLLHRGVGVVGPRLLNPDGSMQPSCYHEPTILGAVREYFFGVKGAYGKYAPGSSNPVKVDAVVGAAMFIPRRTVEVVGFFDERFFLYFEDLDYCRRIKNAGLSIYYLPSAEIVHEHGAAGRDIPEQTKKWLVQSSKLYHGIAKYYLLTLILWLGQKWQKLIRES